MGIDSVAHTARWFGLAFVAIFVTGCAVESDEEEEDTESYASEIAAPGAWSLPADVHAAGQAQYVAYEGAGAWRGEAGCSGRLHDGTREIGDYLREIFPGSISSYSGYACRRNTGNTSQTSVHGTGRALDVFIPTSGGGADNTRGDVVANWLVRHASNIGVQFVIWDRASWNASRSGNKVRGYNGPHPHHDHIHVEITSNAAARRTAFFTGQRPTANGAPVAPPADLAGIAMTGTASRRVEIHTATAKNYGAFAEHEATPLAETDARIAAWAYADYDRDGEADLMLFERAKTDSDKLEVHVLSGASGFQRFLLQTATPITVADAGSFTFREGDYDRDGIPDLYAVKLGATASGFAEVHILSGASNYQKFIAHEPTPHGLDRHAEVQVGDYDRDGRADVFFIDRSATASHKTEVHVLSASSKFRNFILHEATALHETPGPEWSFALGDHDRDGRADLFAITTNGGSGKTEVHALSAASGFKALVLQKPTAFDHVDRSQWVFVVR